MCTYNGSRFLRAQLESIRTQTRPPDELVICDDDSSDDTVGIIEQFRSSAPFPVRLEINTENLGSTKNFEKAISLCQGTLIALADQDDVWLPQKLETIATKFHQESTVGLVFSDAELINEELRPLNARLWASIGFDGDLQAQFKDERAFDILLPGWVVTGATMAFHSRFRTLALPIPDDIPVIHDGWIASLIAAVADVSFIDKPLIKYRVHSEQQIGVPKEHRQRQRNGQSLRQAMHRINSYSHLILVGECVRVRLAETCSLFDSAAALRRLDARIDHLRSRDGMPHGRFNRLPRVLRELLTRRYHLYSNGFHSALKDLMS